MKPIKPKYDNLIQGIDKLLSNTKQQIDKSVNTAMVLTYWHIGQYIVEYEQEGKERAEYGTQLLKRLSEDLTKSFGSGYSWRNLYNMTEFYKQFPILQTVTAKSNSKKLQTVTAKFSEKAISSIPKLNWSHLVRLLSVKNQDERNFYIIETAQNTWSTRELDRQINSSLF